MKRRREMTNRRIRTPGDLDTLSFWENGLLPVVAQDASSGAVLMVAFSNREALEATLLSGQMHYWSRSRQELWHKGATSGNIQELVSLHGDCDGDTLLAVVRPRGPACHTGETTCFGAMEEDGMPSPGTVANQIDGEPPRSPEGEDILPGLWATMEDRATRRPPGSYTVRLLEDENLRLKKLGEEVAELILALSRGERQRIAEEGADLTYHLLAALLAAGVTLDELLDALDRRRG